jgi:hypothetical protein
MAKTMLMGAGDGLADDAGRGQCDKSFGKHLEKSWSLSYRENRRDS